MGNLFSSLRVAGNTLGVLQESLQATQNDIHNASTPGYAKQRTRIEALPFAPQAGLTGGVRSAGLESSRDRYAEGAVRQQLSGLEAASERAQALESLQRIFDLNGGADAAGALREFFDAASAWSVNPTSLTMQEQLLDRAAGVASAFRQAAATLDSARRDLDARLDQNVLRVNQLASELANYNAQRLRSPAADPALDARMHTAAEELSGLLNVSVVYESEGTLSVLLDGQIPLVLSDRAFSLQLDRSGAGDPPGSAPPAILRSADGADAGAIVRSGKLRGLLDARNIDLPYLAGGQGSPGALNTLAAKVADRVNQIFTAGQVSAGPPPVHGSPLFTYDAGNATGVAASLAVSASAQAGSLPLISPGPPPVGNGVALQLAAMRGGGSPEDRIDGMTLLEYFGSMASRTGQTIRAARAETELRQDLLAQARTLRDRLSGISLDEEAVELLALQRSYQAVARIVTSVDELAETVLGMLR